MYVCTCMYVSMYMYVCMHACMNEYVCSRCMCVYVYMYPSMYLYWLRFDNKNIIHIETKYVKFKCMENLHLFYSLTRYSWQLPYTRIIFDTAAQVMLWEGTQGVVLEITYACQTIINLANSICVANPSLLQPPKPPATIYDLALVPAGLHLSAISRHCNLTIWL